MYLGKREIYNPEQHEKHRQECIRYKAGAVWNTFVELEGLINKTQLAEQYFKKSLAWLSQKINGCTVYDKKRNFRRPNTASWRRLSATSPNGLRLTPTR